MTNDLAQARLNMIEGQIRPNKVINSDVLRRFETVPRDAFVPSDKSGMAYADDDIPLGRGRFLLEPMVQARMIQSLDLSGGKVLDIACATGYSSAILAGLAAEVVATDPDPALAEEARKNLQRLALANVLVLTIPVAVGAPEHGPYSAILINGAVADLPPTLASQLQEGGRLVVVKTLTDGFATVGQVWRYEKRNGLLTGRNIMDANCHYLPGCAPQPGFVF